MTSALLAFLFAFKPFFFDAALSQPEPVVRASVVIETSTLREAGAGPAIASRVKRSATAALRAAAIGDDGGPTDPVLAVTVRPLGGQAIGYTSTIAVRKDGRQLSHSRQRYTSTEPFVAEASPIFPEVVAASDGDTIAVPPRRP